MFVWWEGFATTLPAASLAISAVLFIKKCSTIRAPLSAFAVLCASILKNMPMTFTEFPYARPDMADFSARFQHLLSQFESAESYALQRDWLNRINDTRNEFLSLRALCHIRHTINVKDAFYEQENDFFDRAIPTFDGLNFSFYQKLTASPFREQLEAEWGRQLFNLADLNLQTFRPEILEDLQEENALSSAYMKLKAGARIPFRGEEYNLSSIFKLETDPDRDTRRDAAAAKWGYFEAHAAEWDDTFDRLVKTRHRMAQKLGFRNFVEMGYARMLRSDYNAEKVAGFREQIRTAIVPIASALYERQRRRLGLDRLLFFDEDYRFTDGNPRPKGDPEWIMAQADRMYAELSPETAEFFRFMRDNQLMDLPARNDKAPGGYCSFINDQKAPFIFSNFNGTSGDIDVLTHEVGHAFQVYSSRHIGINEYNWPSYDACEIHSMSMEFFTWPWMPLFFGEDAQKYYFAHLSGCISFLPYGVAVDEFQHVVYENPEWTPDRRRQAWRDIERKYLPHRDYDGNAYLESGAFWHKQNHIFGMPFYYIDYVLAQVCAFQFWIKNREDHASAWSDYLRLCQAGGSRSFLELTELAGLRSPFAPGCMEDVAGAVSQWLGKTDF
jgi:M3 family oligoendopeptidase